MKLFLYLIHEDQVDRLIDGRDDVQHGIELGDGDQFTDMILNTGKHVGATGIPTKAVTDQQGAQSGGITILYIGQIDDDIAEILVVEHHDLRLEFRSHATGQTGLVDLDDRVFVFSFKRQVHGERFFSNLSQLREFATPGQAVLHNRVVSCWWSDPGSKCLATADFKLPTTACLLPHSGQQIQHRHPTGDAVFDLIQNN